MSDKNYINGSSTELNVRVFRRRRNHLVIEDNNAYCTKKITGRLSFSLSNDEGICVKAYKSKRSTLEIEDASKGEYHLSERQKILAGDLKFVVAVPLHPDRGEKIKYVICFDSFQKIAKSGCEQGILKQSESIAYLIGSLLK